MKVIACGFPKCGTKTLALAFTELGLNNYDYEEQFVHLHDNWMKILTDGGSREDFRKMFENVDSVTDIPACFFWEEILEAFPDAKVSRFINY